ncbi:hypothetical protein [Ancylobacter mangrovi]|uniref:hypothetical protein n=1 Tax=Ancylobacter mangrovi TaxID=2972472 RepID=UPI002163CCED|nr:hypothetical protein [Ancylobacter mangrovi]MCS0502527.1 hypothetical protein [Ancylobacter mangrovi]
MTAAAAGIVRSVALVGAAWLVPAAPAFAGVAEREPPSAVLWLLVVGVAALSWVMACRRWWLPLALWVPVALFDSSLVADLVDPVIGPAVREELGLSYMMQADLTSALTLVLPLMFANLMFSRREQDKAKLSRDIWRR